MFQNKHIIRASFVGLFLAILASILFYRYFTIKNIVLDSVIKDNNKISSYYINNIWSQYVISASLLKPIDLEQAIHNKAFRDFSETSLEYLNNQDKAKISILDKDGVEFLTTQRKDLIKNNISTSSIIKKFDIVLDNHFLGKRSYQDSLSEVRKGNNSHNVIVDSTFGNPNEGSIHAYIESFFPIIDNMIDNEQPIGIIRIVTDITPLWNKITYFEKRVSIVLMSVFTIFFVIIIFNTHHAQRIIDQQVANNKYLEEAKTRAESESSAKTQFLANVSHELRTPLNAIIGFSEVILTEAYGKLDHPQYAEYIQDINNSGKHLLSVINDILDFSKASADKLKVDIIEVDVTKLASSSLRFVKPRADEANVKLLEKLPAEHIVIKADPKRLKQALLNLLSNSVKFTPANGSVTLELEKNIQDKLVNIKVIDTGIGMEEKDIPKALSSFGQIDNKLSRKYEGTGLGLPLTKKLVELMGGKFEITSKLGTGTTVIISFRYEDF